MKANLLFVTAVAVCLSLQGCNTDDDSGDGNANPARSELVARNWRLTDFLSGSSPNQLTSNWAELDSCSRDNILQISTNGSYVLDEGQTKCDPMDPQVNESGTWALLNNETQFRNIVGIDTTVSDIIELTATRFKLQTAAVINDTMLYFQGVYTAN